MLDQTVAIYFDHTTLKYGAGWEDKPGLYNRDYQPNLEIGESRTWQFAVYTDKPNAKMILSWKDVIGQIPDDTMLYFRQSGETDWQDMRQVRSVDLDSHSRITKILFEVRAERFDMSPLKDLSVISGEAQVKIKWAANDNPFITCYTISRHVGQDAILSETAQNSILCYNLEADASQFVDTDVEEEATYTYQIITHFKSGAELKSELFTVTVLPVIKETVLLQCYPNPFNPETWIPYELEREAGVMIELYNVNGQIIRTLNLGVQPRGRYISKEKAAHWDGRTQTGERAASGVYFYVMKARSQGERKAGEFTATRKMVILK